MRQLMKHVKLKSEKYFETNILFLAFLLSNLLNAFFLRLFTGCNPWDIRPLLLDLAFLLIVGSFVYFFAKPKQKVRYFILCSIVLTMICIINSMYYTFYTSFASVSLLPSTIFVVDVGDAITKNVVEIKDFFYLWQPISFYCIHRFLEYKGYYKKHSFEKNHKLALNNNRNK